MRMNLENPITIRRMQNMNILIVDDEMLIVEDLKRDVLELFPGSTVLTASNAADALAIAENTAIDTALLDIDMPDGNGLDLARELAALNPVVNIIFVTAYPEYALEAHELYCSAFLLKPTGIRKLKKAFENLRKPFIDLPPEYYKEHYQGGAVIGERLKTLREQRNLSRNDVAQYMGVTRQTVFRWETGERMPDVITFIKLARLLGAEIDDIIKSIGPSLK